MPKKLLNRILKSSPSVWPKKIAAYNPIRLQSDINALYGILYRLTHDMEAALDLSSHLTEEAFARQWHSFKEGKYLLSDPWFRENVDKILSEEELQIRKEWFLGKAVLDIGCGNGRWSYGFAKLGSNITSVDISPEAVYQTQKALEPFHVQKAFYTSSVEDLSQTLPSNKYDLVFCWGVLHHCKSFNRSLQEAIRFVQPSGILYLYLYGRESVSYLEDIELFKDRIRYNSLATKKEKYQFLLKKARNDKAAVHNMHDIYAPLINRRLEFSQVKKLLQQQGFEDVSQTIDHTELFVRAIRGNSHEYYANWILPRKTPPYWFQHH